MEATTLDLIHTNRVGAAARVQSEVAEFATIAAVGDYSVGSTCGGQIRWAIIRPVSALSAAQRRQLRSAGFEYGRHGLGDNWQFGDSNRGWCKK